VVAKIFGPKVGKLAYYTSAEFDLWGLKCIISCTGYTGELGYEIYIPNAKVGDLWDLLLKDPRVKPAGLGCRDTLRLEMAFPLYGHELDTAHTPIDAGLEKFVDFSKDFAGKEALRQEQRTGVAEHLICFKSASRRAARNGYAIYSGDTRVGAVTSGSFSPSLGVSIGMGYVSAAAPVDSELLIKDAGVEIPVTVVRKPFYRK
jgi:aminomethyltransferase